MAVRRVITEWLVCWCLLNVNQFITVGFNQTTLHQLGQMSLPNLHNLISSQRHTQRNTHTARFCLLTRSNINVTLAIYFE